MRTCCPLDTQESGCVQITTHDYCSKLVDVVVLILKSLFAIFHHISHIHTCVHCIGLYQLSVVMAIANSYWSLPSPVSVSSLELQNKLREYNGYYEGKNGQLSCKEVSALHALSVPSTIIE